MSIADIIKNARTDVLDDAVKDYQWSDAQLNRFAFEALYEACKRSPLIEKVTTISIVAATSEYTLENTVRQIYTAKLSLQETPLIQTTDAELSLFVSPGWRESTGTPTHYIRVGKTLRLYPEPEVDDTLVFTHSALPESAADIDLVDEYYHDGLESYIAYKAFLMPDVDAYNPKKAESYLEDFNNFYGQPKSAKFDLVSQSTPMYGSIIGGRMA